MWGLLATIFSGLIGMYTANKAEKAQDRATDVARTAALQQEQRALKQEKDNDMAQNRANAKKPNANAILAAAQQAGKSGASGTMLTGSSGIGQDLLSLSRSSLLGA